MAWPRTKKPVKTCFFGQNDRFWGTFRPVFSDKTTGFGGHLDRFFRANDRFLGAFRPVFEDI